ncbi:hypothetical protein F2Q70_00031614 [Brassica cretica]|uniref:Uncharacterized protein n=1 Tax=Brassica cretica TaxID=69181 RepID=A0A8S9FF88_BRACR|nr:hypothetical protein F2Q70_00031614 [Brassica cretica]
MTSLPDRTNHYLIQIHTTFRDGCDVLNAHLLQDRSPNKLFTTTHKATVGDLQKGKSDLTKALTLKADSHLHRPASDLQIDQREPEERRAKIKREQGRSGNASGSVETVAGASYSSSEFSSVLSP